jgi:hypothetical protein
MQPTHWPYMKKADRNAPPAREAIHKPYSDCVTMEVVFSAGQFLYCLGFDDLLTDTKS